MPVNKDQLQRLIKLTALLKENRYPSPKKVVESLRRAIFYEECSLKTVQRDFKILKEEFNAPLAYDYQQGGYYLKHHGWNFEYPALQDETLLASVLGAKLAEDMMPEPVKSDIRNAVDLQLTTNNPDFLDTAFISSLIVASGIKVNIDPDVFRTVFLGWLHRKALRFHYQNAEGNHSEKTMNPQALVYYNSAWYIKGECLQANGSASPGEPIRVYALHRIISPHITTIDFVPNPIIIEQIRQGHVFDFEEVKNIKIWGAPEIAPYIREQHISRQLTIHENADGSVDVNIPSLAKHELIRLILGEAGKIKLLEPADMQKEICSAAQKIIDIHRGQS